MTATPTCSDLERASEAVRAGRDGFAEVYRTHHRAVFLYLCRRLGDAHAAEDVAAEVFVTAMRKWRQARRRDAPVRAWLYRIASYKAGHWARANRRRVLRERQTMAAEVTQSDGGIEIDAVQAAFLSLQRRHQHVLSLFYFADLRLDQIAEVDGCAVGTVKSRLTRAREAMRAELKRRSEHYGN